MPAIKPFKAIIYNQDAVRDIALVVAPPYDVIPPDVQDRLYKKSPFNIVRLILGKIKKSDRAEDNRYTRARESFKSWLEEDIMVRDSKEALYIYSQKYRYGKRAIERMGFIGLMGLGLEKDSTVLPHEKTLLAPKADRLSLMREVKANLSPIFVLYDDRSRRIADIMKKHFSKDEPFIDIAVDGVRHRVWRLDDEKTIADLERIMRPKEIFIADGHHRYEVACSYAKEVEKSGLSSEAREGAKYMMVYFVDSDERMLTILPTHRVVKKIGTLTKEDIIKRLKEFACVERSTGLNVLMSKLAREHSSHVFGMCLGASLYFLKLKGTAALAKAIKDKPKEWRDLDVSILHHFIFRHVLGVRDEDDNMEYVKDPRQAVDLVKKGKFKAAFLLNPTKVAQVKRVAKIGERMPKKATYFYPKPLSGLVINKF